MKNIYGEIQKIFRLGVDKLRSRVYNAIRANKCLGNDKGIEEQGTAARPAQKERMIKMGDKSRYIEEIIRLMEECNDIELLELIRQILLIS